MQEVRITDLTDKSREDLSAWFSVMAQRCPWFHPEDSPRDIIRTATDKPTFTLMECAKLDAIMEEHVFHVWGWRLRRSVLFVHESCGASAGN